MKKRLVLFELNEVPVRVLDLFVAEFPKSSLAQLLATGAYVKTTSVDSGNLSPWITWPTLHRGVDNTKHGLTSFGQPLQKTGGEFPPIWQLLAANGLSVGVFGSLHSYPIPADTNNYSFYIPDTFASGPECIPTSIAAFQAFNLAMVSESARNVSRNVPMSALAFLPKAWSVGITLKSCWQVVVQLTSEFVQPWKRTRRRSFQAILGFDVFYKLLRGNRPQFATFFTNHFASAMHRYWAARFPEDFDRSEFDDEWRQKFRGEISLAMQQADTLVGKLMQYCAEHEDTILLVTSSMGQAAHDARRVSTQLVLVEPEVFMREMGMSDGLWEKRPAMVPQFNCVVRPQCEGAFNSALASLSVNGQILEYVTQPGGFFSICFGHLNLTDANCNIRLGNKIVPAHSVGLSNISIEDEAGSTAYHIPEGILLAYDPTRSLSKAAAGTVQTTAIAPAICDFFSVPLPAYMQRSPALHNIVTHDHH